MGNITLGIETSCDETAIGIYCDKRGLIAHQLHSQIALHNQYGGVVPELASRDHIKRIRHLINLALTQANITQHQLTGIAYTAGPGLAGALLVGVSVGKSLAFALNIPALAVHHLEGHLLSPLLEQKTPSFPFLCLLVSGGHSQLIEVKSLGKYNILGESLDDAAGEAFDKTAKLMGLGYPGGKVLSDLAKTGDTQRFAFPRPLLHRDTLDFSFSGLKTAVRHAFLAIENPTQQDKADIAASFETAVVDVLYHKTQKALQRTNLTQCVVAGGVSANSTLRQRFNQLKVETFYPKLEFCTDNGAMIALVGHLYLSQGERDTSLCINIQPRWSIEKRHIL